MKGIILEPVSVSKPEEFYNNHGFCGMRVNVCYAGDVGRIMQKSDAVVGFEKICPFGARVINHNYDSDKDRTSVNYLFESGMFRGGHRRAHRFRNRVVSSIKYKPLDVVGCVPSYVKGEDGVEKSQGWLLRVVFSGDIVPPDMQGADVLSHFTKDAPEQYADKCSQITRVEYLFPDSMFGNNFKRVCRAENDIRTQIEEQYLQDVISPVFVCDKPVLKDYGYEVLVKYNGNCKSCFPRFSNRFEYNPFGAQITNWTYNKAENTSNVFYRFHRGILNSGAKRAWGFVANIKSQIAGTERDENIK